MICFLTKSHILCNTVSLLMPSM